MINCKTCGINKMNLYDCGFEFILYKIRKFISTICVHLNMRIK